MITITIIIIIIIIVIVIIIIIITIISIIVLRQKGESQNGCFKKTKHSKFSEKHIFYPLIRKKCSFFGKFGVLCFLKTPVLRFAILSYYRRNYLQMRHNDTLIFLRG